ncbi:uncharacterized protein [Cherax quadricarinatus]
MYISTEEFAKLARQERKKAQCMEDEGTQTWYMIPLLSFEGDDFPLADLLRCCFKVSDLPPVILASGEAGIGKTSLCQYLEESWITKSNNIKDLEGYDLLLFIRCRDVTSPDLIRLLKEDLLPETTAFYDPHTLYMRVNQLKVVWVVDGFEEATNEAIKLLTTMLERQPKSHIVLVTSRPEHSLTFTTHFVKKKILNLTVCGVDPVKALQKWRPADSETNFTQRAKCLISPFKKLNIEVQQELRNPLKLKLALQDWDNTCQDFKNVFDLCRLYERITNAQRTSLVKKFMNRNVTEREATRKVDKFFEMLCKVAFDMTRKQQITTISESVLRELENECDDLQLSSTECLSAFLAYQNRNQPLGSSRHTFLHNTQQYFLAALHARPVFTSSSNILSLVEEMFGVSLNCPRESLVHFYNVFLHIISFLKNSISDDGLDILVKILCLSICHDNGSSQWFEVVQKGSYAERLTKRVGEVIPEDWSVCDSFIKAARYLMKYKMPNTIVIRLKENPSHSPDLLPFLQKIADFECLVWVELYISYHMRVNKNNTSDKYLKVLCGDDSTCGILGFEGNLSEQGYDLLNLKNITEYCEILNLKVKSVKSLKYLCNTVPNLQAAKELTLIFAPKECSWVSDYLPVQVLPEIRINLELPYMTDSNAEDTASLMSELSHNYNTITVSNVTYLGAKCFVVKLEEKGVEVKSLVRMVQHERTIYPLTLPYGPVPIVCDILEFMERWYCWKEWRKHNPQGMDSGITSSGSSEAYSKQRVSELLIGPQSVPPGRGLSHQKYSVTPRQRDLCRMTNRHLN